MLQPPQRDFSRSVSENNVRRDSMADWLEASLIFFDGQLSKSDVVDVLIEEQICSSDNQDIAHEIADMGWSELELRHQQSGGGIKVNVSRMRVEVPDNYNWTDEPVRAFLLVLSIMRLYPDWAREHRDAPHQGELFERVVEGLCPGLLPGWSTYRAGWSPGSVVSIPQIVNDLCERLHTKGHPELGRWVPEAAKDGGLDIVCYRSFPDRREAVPAFFLQCASGTNWRLKINTPNADEWKKYLDAAVQPSTGIAAPFVISEKDVRYAGLHGQIIVFDRLRLMSALLTEGLTLSDELRTELVEWIKNLIPALPQMS